jgi:hypothetical protein
VIVNSPVGEVDHDELRLVGRGRVLARHGGEVSDVVETNRHLQIHARHGVTLVDAVEPRDVDPAITEEAPKRLTGAQATAPPFDVQVARMANRAERGPRSRGLGRGGGRHAEQKSGQDRETSQPANGHQVRTLPESTCTKSERG